MSADNFLAIKKEGKYWYVWMAFASDDTHPIPDDAEMFNSKEKARDYAFEELDSDYYEYGINELK